MTGTLVFWLAIAVPVFWAVGAHNRLARLRAAILQAYAQVHAAGEQQEALLENCLRAMAQSFPNFQSAAPGGNAVERWAALSVATAQFRIALAAAQSHPLDASAIKALADACNAQCAAWDRLCHECRDLAGEPVPQTVLEQWTRLSQQTAVARVAFNLATAQHDAAIRAAPARFLARFMGFQPVGAL